MEVQPTPGQEAFIRQAIESGRIHSPEDAIKEALSLWEENERRRAAILSTVDEAEECIQQGRRTKLVSSEQQAAQLAEATKRRGMARLLAEQIGSCS